MDPRSVVFVSGGGLLLAAFALAPTGGWRALLWQVLVWTTVLGIRAGVRHHRPSQPGAWRYFTVGIGLMGVGALSDPAIGLVTALPASRPVLDGLLLVGYPLICLGVLRFARAQSGGRDHGPVLDSLIFMVAVTTVLWEVALGRQALWVEGAGGELLPILALSAITSWGAAMAVRFHLAGGFSAFSGWLMLAAALLSCVGAATFAWNGAIAAGIANAPRGSTLLWSGALLTLGVSALHPSMVALTRPSERAAAPVLTQTALPALALLTPPTAILVRHAASGELAPVATVAAAVTAVLVVLRFADLMRDRDRAQRLLHHQSLHDALTGLPNRRWLDVRLRELLQPGRAPGDAGVAVLFLDLDGFKAVNDSLGHGAGDELLVEVAQRLRAGCRGEDALARVGGDEFVILLDGIEERRAVALATRLREALCAPVRLAGAEVAVDASVGVALAATVGADAERLLVAADDAMYAAKRAGRGRVCLAPSPRAHSADGHRLDEMGGAGATSALQPAAASTETSAASTRSGAIRQ